MLGSILGALKAIVNVIGIKNDASIEPATLGSIMKNRHEKVGRQHRPRGSNCRQGAEYVSAREWMRICFELLEMLKAHKKGIRRQ